MIGFHGFNVSGQMLWHHNCSMIIIVCLFLHGKWVSHLPCCANQPQARLLRFRISYFSWVDCWCRFLLSVTLVLRISLDLTRGCRTTIYLARLCLSVCTPAAQLCTLAKSNPAVVVGCYCRMSTIITGALYLLHMNKFRQAQDDNDWLSCSGRSLDIYELQAIIHHRIPIK